MLRFSFVLLIIRWIEEIERKQAEMVAAQIALEKLRQRNHLLTTENEMIKVRDVNNFLNITPQQVVTIFKSLIHWTFLQMENVNHKKMVIELEADIKKLSGQQNLQQRIHHHAKIKVRITLLPDLPD